MWVLEGSEENLFILVLCGDTNVDLFIFNSKSFTIKDAKTAFLKLFIHH